MPPILHTAQYLVNAYSAYGSITPMKLQKLLYYVKAWGLLEDQDLAPGAFEKWPYGPVNRDVYHAFKEFGAAPVQPKLLPPAFEPQGRARVLVDFIATSYVSFSALALSAMTHREPPWKEAALNAVITEEAMRAFYGARHPFRRNFPFSPEQPYTAVPSDASAAFTLDMSRADAARVKTYPTYQAYLAHLERLRQYDPSANDVLNRLLA